MSYSQNDANADAEARLQAAGLAWTTSGSGDAYVVYRAGRDPQASMVASSRVSLEDAVVKALGGMDHPYDDAPDEALHRAASAFTDWLDTFISEKGIDPDEDFELQAGGQANFFTYGVVLEAIKNAPAHEQRGIKDMLVRIDFKNGDVRHYLRHLAQALADNHARQTGEMESEGARHDATCEKCGASAVLSGKGGTQLEIQEGEEWIPALLTPEGWLLAGLGGAHADMEWCPNCARDLFGDLPSEKGAEGEMAKLAPERREGRAPKEASLRPTALDGDRPKKDIPVTMHDSASDVSDLEPSGPVPCVEHGGDCFPLGDHHLRSQLGQDALSEARRALQTAPNAQEAVTAARSVLARAALRLVDADELSGYQGRGNEALDHLFDGLERIAENLSSMFQDEQNLIEAAKMCGFEAEMGGGGSIILHLDTADGGDMTFGFVNGPLGVTVFAPGRPGWASDGEVIYDGDMERENASAEEMADFIGQIASKFKAHQGTFSSNEGSESLGGTASRKASLRRVAYVSHVPGHTNSKGEAAPWVIKSHEDGHIISSHKSEEEAKHALMEMHAHEGSLRRKASNPWNVYLNGELIDTVFDSSDSADDVRRSLINHDGYDSDIEVEFGGPTDPQTGEPQLAKPRTEKEWQTPKESPEQQAERIRGQDKAQLKEAVKELLAQGPKDLDQLAQALVGTDDSGSDEYDRVRKAVNSLELSDRAVVKDQNGVFSLGDPSPNPDTLRQHREDDEAKGIFTRLSPEDARKPPKASDPGNLRNKVKPTEDSPSRPGEVGMMDQRERSSRLDKLLDRLNVEKDPTKRQQIMQQMRSLKAGLAWQRKKAELKEAAIPKEVDVDLQVVDPEVAKTAEERPLPIMQGDIRRVTKEFRANSENHGRGIYATPPAGSLIRVEEVYPNGHVKFVLLPEDGQERDRYNPPSLPAQGQDENFGHKGEDMGSVYMMSADAKTIEASTELVQAGQLPEHGPEDKPTMEWSGGDADDTADWYEQQLADGNFDGDRDPWVLKHSSLQDEWDESGRDGTAFLALVKERGLEKSLKEALRSMAYEDTDAMDQQYQDLVDYLTEVMNDIAPGNTVWRVNLRGFGWMKEDNDGTVTAKNGQELLNAVLPNTDNHFKIYNRGSHIEIDNAHHDAPMGGEMYYISPFDAPPPNPEPTPAAVQRAVAPEMGDELEEYHQQRRERSRPKDAPQPNTDLSEEQMAQAPEFPAQVPTLDPVEIRHRQDALLDRLNEAEDPQERSQIEQQLRSLKAALAGWLRIAAVSFPKPGEHTGHWGWVEQTDLDELWFLVQNDRNLYDKAWADFKGRGLDPEAVFEESYRNSVAKIPIIMTWLERHFNEINQTYPPAPLQSGESEMSTEDVPVEDADSLLDRFNEGGMSEDELRRRMRQVSSGLAEALVIEGGIAMFGNGRGSMGGWLSKKVEGGVEDEVEPGDFPPCPACDGPGMPLGQLGNLMWYRCQNCGMNFNKKDEMESEGADQSAGESSPVPPMPYHDGTPLDKEAEEGAINYRQIAQDFVEYANERGVVRRVDPDDPWSLPAEVEEFLFDALEQNPDEYPGVFVKPSDQPGTWGENNIEEVAEKVADLVSMPEQGQFGLMGE